MPYKGKLGGVQASSAATGPTPLASVALEGGDAVTAVGTATQDSAITSHRRNKAHEDGSIGAGAGYRELFEDVIPVMQMQTSNLPTATTTTPSPGGRGRPASHAAPVDARQKWNKLWPPIREMDQYLLRHAFEIVYGVPTKSNNNDYLAKKLEDAVGDVGKQKCRSIAIEIPPKENSQRLEINIRSFCRPSMFFIKCCADDTIEEVKRAIADKIGIAYNWRMEPSAIEICMGDKVLRDSETLDELGVNDNNRTLFLM